MAQCPFGGFTTLAVEPPRRLIRRRPGRELPLQWPKEDDGQQIKEAVQRMAQDDPDLKPLQDSKNGVLWKRTWPSSADSIRMWRYKRVRNA